MSSIALFAEGGFLGFLMIEAAPPDFEAGWEGEGVIAGLPMDAALREGRLGAFFDAHRLKPGALSVSLNADDAAEMVLRLEGGRLELTLAPDGEGRWRAFEGEAKVAAGRCEQAEVLEEE